MVVRQSLLGPALRRVGRQNAQHEYYLTDLVAVLHEMGHVTQDRSCWTTPARRRASTTGSSSPRRDASCARASTTSGCSAACTMWNPADTYVDADVELARRGVAAAGHDPEGSLRHRPRRADRAERRPRRRRASARTPTSRRSRRPTRASAPTRASRPSSCSRPGADVATGEVVTPRSPALSLGRRRSPGTLAPWSHSPNDASSS